MWKPGADGYRVTGSTISGICSVTRHFSTKDEFIFYTGGAFYTIVFKSCCDAWTFVCDALPEMAKFGLMPGELHE